MSDPRLYTRPAGHPFPWRVAENRLYVTIRLVIHDANGIEVAEICDSSDVKIAHLIVETMNYIHFEAKKKEFRTTE